ncbi:CBASS cGAMP-activated phospholipase [Paenibacillus sp. BR2-3]|uniref:CBASS cGAMP-activated phospholipase n=1 Tax=Paenibacillus sp. BR2-3 TaxID=3048494 RepID=UPI00397779BD
MNSNCYKILAIDGGGIKGLYSAVILSHFEDRFGPIHRHFNLICGTSTGGIIALALASGIKASEVVRFYTEMGPKIFPYHNKWRRKFHFGKSLLFTSKYKDIALKSALEGVFGDRRVGDCSTNVLIPTFNITTGEPYVFKSDHVPALTRDKDRLLTDVALATSAAPTYFPIAEMQTMKGTEQFIDGGVWANNPSLLGITEFLTHYNDDNRYHNYALLSVSSLNERVRFPDHLKVKKRMSFFKWNQDLFSLMIDSQSGATHNFINYLLRSSVGGEYLRIPSTELTPAQKGYISLDYACKKSLKIMEQKGMEKAIEWIDKAELQAFFEVNNKEATA